MEVGADYVVVLGCPARSSSDSVLSLEVVVVIGIDVIVVVDRWLDLFVDS